MSTCDVASLTNTQAALLLGGTVLAGIASLAYYDKSTQQKNNSTTTSLQLGGTTSLATKNYLLSVCSNYPDDLQLLEKLLWTVVSSADQQRKVLTEFKYFILKQCFFVTTFNTFTFVNEQSLIDSTGDQTKLLAFLSLVCYELQAKKVLK